MYSTSLVQGSKVEKSWFFRSERSSLVLITIEPLNRFCSNMGRSKGTTVPFQRMSNISKNHFFDYFGQNVWLRHKYSTNAHGLVKICGFFHYFRWPNNDFEKKNGSETFTGISNNFAVYFLVFFVLTSLGYAVKCICIK